MFANYGKTELRKQIGNAVPPIIYKAILESVKRTLAEEDAACCTRSASKEAAAAAEEEHQQQQHQQHQQSSTAAFNVIVLD